MKNKIIIHPADIEKGKVMSYDFSNLKIAFCTEPDNSGRVKITSYFDSCRESAVNLIRNQIEDSDPPLASKRIDLKKTRILLYAKSNNDATIESKRRFSKRKDKEIALGIKLVNHYEKKLGWLLTKMVKVDIDETNRNYSKISKIKRLKNAKSPFLTPRRDDVSDTINMYIIVATNKWLKSPHILSLYLLMLRLGCSGFKSNFKTHEELIKDLEKFSNRRGFKDSHHVRDTFKMWDVILENYNKLFKRKSINRLYSSKYLINGCQGFSEGITRLCTGLSRDNKISMEIADICKRNNIEFTYKVKIKKEGKEW